MNAGIDSYGAALDLQEKVISALRQELEEYGGLLSLLDLQQDAVIERKPDAILDLVGRIDRQLKATSTKREHRQAATAELKSSVGLDHGVPLRELTPHFRAPVRPMVEALADEVNRLVNHTKRRAQQNQALLARAVEFSREALEQIRPRSVFKTYSAKGRVHLKAAGEPMRLQG